MPERLHTTSGSAAGVGVAVAGVGFIAAGGWARSDVRRTLARERIVSADAKRSNGSIATARAARSMAEVVRRNTLEASRGRTYSEVEPYLTVEGAPTGVVEQAAKDERTGQPLENPEHELWMQSITLEGALMQAYMAFRLAELTIGFGAALVATGVGLAAAGRRQ